MKQLVQVCLANKGNRSELGLNWGHKHMNNCQSCCAPMTWKGLGLVQCAFHSLYVLLSQQRSLVLVSLDVYLASCLSICLSYSVTVKGP